MKTLQHILASLALATLCLACGPNNSNSSTAMAKQTAISVDSLLQTTSSAVDDTIVVEGICKHICKHGATKIFLQGTDDTQMVRVEAGQLGRFSKECLSHFVEVTGVVREERIDENYLVRWETQLADQSQGQENGQVGCEADGKAHHATGNTAWERINSYRKRIAQRQEHEDKAYLSFYYVEALAYTVQ